MPGWTETVFHSEVDPVHPGEPEKDLAEGGDQHAAGRVETVEAVFGGSRSSGSELRYEVASLHKLNTALAVQLQEKQAQLQLSQTGKIVRGMQLMSEMSLRLPAPARVTLRTVLLGVWWAATPHLTGKRLSIRRARHDADGSDGKPQGVTGRTAPLSALVQKTEAAINTVRSLKAVAVGCRSSAIDFRPLPTPGQDPDLTVDRNGSYAFAGEGDRYVYVPPRRPDRSRANPVAVGQPRFSIVVPVYNTDPDLLKRMVASVREQWYAGWELLLVDDASPDERTRAALSNLDDPRIRVERAAENGGISAATNIAIARATGDYVVFLDHDDELTIDCLHELASCIRRDDPDFIYSDEDKIDTEGCYTQPFFKPDWSPDTMMSTMFTCHVMCVRRTMFDIVGGLRSTFDGSQDYDFVLRLVEHTDRISHIPKVLYHWRIIPASVASDMNAKPYAVEASRRAREAALDRRGLAGTVEPVPEMPVYFRVNYQLQRQPLISIIVPTKNNAAVLERCVTSIHERTRYANFEIIVMDNGSTQADALAVLRNFEWQPRTKVQLHRRPFNYSEINNTGVRTAEGELLVFLNDDTEILADDWLERMGGYAQLAHVGAVGAKLLYPETRRVQHNGVLNLDQGPVHALHNMPAHEPGPFMRNLLEWNWTAVTGACLMIERRKFVQAGGFDESFPIAYNDVKLCFDLRDLGYYNLVCPSVELIHHESLSRGMDRQSPQKLARLERERVRLYQVCPQHFMRDPFHNPNLSATGIQFELPSA